MFWWYPKASRMFASFNFIEANSSENQMRSCRRKYFENEGEKAIQFECKLKPHSSEVLQGVGKMRTFLWQMSQREYLQGYIYSFIFWDGILNKLIDWNFSQMLEMLKGQHSKVQFVAKPSKVFLFITVLSSFWLGDLRQMMLSYLGFLVCH